MSVFSGLCFTSSPRSDMMMQRVRAQMPVAIVSVDWLTQKVSTMDYSIP